MLTHAWQRRLTLAQITDMSVPDMVTQQYTMAQGVAPNVGTLPLKRRTSGSRTCPWGTTSSLRRCAAGFRRSLTRSRSDRTSSVSRRLQRHSVSTSLGTEFP